MKKFLATALATAIIGTSQALPMADTLIADIAPTTISASAADNTPAQVKNFEASNIKYTSATLSWSKVKGAKGYRVYVYNTSTKKYKKVKTISKNSTTSLDLTGLKQGTAYKYKIRAYNKVNGKNVWGKTSAESLTTKSYAPAKITGVKATGITKTSATLTWNKNSKATGYRVYVYNTSTKKYDKVTTITKNTTTSYKLTGLKAGTTYKYKVRGYRNYKGKTYWGTSSAVCKVTTTANASSSANVDKAYQSLIVGNSTAADRELIRQDLIAYAKKAHPEMTFDERIYAMVDKNGNPTNIFADAVAEGNSCWASGVDAVSEITDYYVFNKDINKLTQTFKNDCYESVEFGLTYWNQKREVPLDRFNIVIYLNPDNWSIEYNTGKDLPRYVIITPVSSEMMIEAE